jgi:hypothetical protein
MRRIEAELAQQEIEEKQATTKQVFMTNKGDEAGQAIGDLPSQAAHDEDAGKEQGNPRHQPPIPPQNNCPRFRADLGLCNPPFLWCTT